MEAYQQALEKVAEKEMSSVVFGVIVLLIVLVALWVSQFIYFKKMKKHPKKYHSKKQVNIRRQSIGASIALSVIAIGLGTIVCSDVVSTVSAIHKDIETNSYVTYTGDYHVHPRNYTNAVHDKWISVDFDNNSHALLYVDSLFERLLLDEGSFEGKVVYGQNSLVIVEIEN